MDRLTKRTAQPDAKVLRIDLNSVGKKIVEMANEKDKKVKGKVAKTPA